MAGLKFRVLLDSSGNNEIFRDILIKDSANFETFYFGIMDAFSFSKDQMASFYVSNDEWDKGQEITLLDMAMEEDTAEDLALVMKNSSLKDQIIEPDQKFILVHDFMRMWIFLIELIGYDREEPEYPQVVLSVGDAPREDSKQPEDNDDLFLGEDGEEDEFGFDDFDDDYSDEDFSNFDEYDY